MDDYIATSYARPWANHPVDVSAKHIVGFEDGTEVHLTEEDFKGLVIEDPHGPVPDPHPGILALGKDAMRQRPGERVAFMHGVYPFWVRRCSTD